MCEETSACSILWIILVSYS